jgi:hypothetical protein
MKPKRPAFPEHCNDPAARQLRLQYSGDQLAAKVKPPIAVSREGPSCRG